MDSAKKECPSWNLHRTRIACIRIPFRFTGTQHWPQKMLTRCQFFIPRDGPRGRHTFSQERKNDGTVLPFRQLTKPLSPVSRAFIVQPFQLTFSLHNFNVQIFRRSLFSLTGKTRIIFQRHALGSVSLSLWGGQLPSLRGEIHVKFWIN